MWSFLYDDSRIQIDTFPQETPDYIQDQGFESTKFVKSLFFSFRSSHSYCSSSLPSEL